MSMNKKIKVNLTEQDLEDLQRGKTFNWTFNGVDVYLYKGDDDE